MNAWKIMCGIFVRVIGLAFIKKRTSIKDGYKNLGLLHLERNNKKGPHEK